MPQGTSSEGREASAAGSADPAANQEIPILVAQTPPGQLPPDKQGAIHGITTLTEEAARPMKTEQGIVLPRGPVVEPAGLLRTH